MKKSYKKIQFMPYELSEKEFEIYSNSEFTLYKYLDDDCYLCSENSTAFPYEIGTLKDVEQYLLVFDF